MTRASVFTGAVLAAATAAAWVALLVSPGEMPMDGGPGSAAVFVAAWLVMMTAMMVPSAAPLVLLYRRGAGAGPTAVLVAGYLLVWGAFGVGVYALHQGAIRIELEGGSFAVALVVLAAGAYQLTPLKSACLRRCRSPMDFLVRRYGAGPLRLGVEHGVYCVGCCWGLMAVLIVAGAMALVWAAAIAMVVAAEKLLPVGRGVSRAAGLALVAMGAAALLT